VLTDPDLLGSRRWRELSAADMRQMTVSEFAAWLGGMTNKEDRPFQEHTIRNYADAARTLDRWMTASEIDADFTACDTTVLNRFLADYLRTHTQGGTNTAAQPCPPLRVPRRGLRPPQPVHRPAEQVRAGEETPCRAGGGAH
jgi:hypothetical protein